jgi:hypothetical protein
LAISLIRPRNLCATAGLVLGYNANSKFAASW